MPSTTDNSLLLPDACAARRVFVREAVKHIQACGSVLWAFGMVEDHSRRALAIVMQTAAALVEGTLLLLDAGNRYAASALIRQLIEIEYLLVVFRTDTGSANAWLTASDEKARTRFRPAQMRRRSGERFQASEYPTHCEIGGHPHPRGGGLLPERYFGHPEAEVRLREFLWLDFAIHLDRVWNEYEATRDAFSLVNIVVAATATVKMREEYQRWHEADRLGRDVVESRAKHTARNGAPAG